MQNANHVFPRFQADKRLFEVIQHLLIRTTHFEPEATIFDGLVAVIELRLPKATQFERILRQQFGVLFARYRFGYAFEDFDDFLPCLIALCQIHQHLLDDFARRSTHHRPCQAIDCP